MRTHSPSSLRFARALIAAALLVPVAACGGGSSGTSPLPNPGSSQTCDTANNFVGVTLARPTPGFPNTAGQIEIVSGSSNDDLHGSFAQFDLNLIDNSGNRVVTGPLSIVSDSGGPKPYGPNNAFYYSGTLQQTPISGDVYTVYLNAPNSNCTLLPLGTIQT